MKINTVNTIMKYKGKEYSIWRTKEEQKVRPIDEEENESKEITVKDYKIGNWNVTVNVNGETSVVGWGPSKHLIVWGSVVFLVMIIFFAVRRYFWLKKNNNDRKLYIITKNI